MSIDNWQFANYKNKLQIAIKTDASSPSGNECTDTQSSADAQGNLRWIQISLNGVFLYLSLFFFVFLCFFFFTSDLFCLFCLMKVDMELSKK